MGPGDRETGGPEDLGTGRLGAEGSGGPEDQGTRGSGGPGEEHRSGDQGIRRTRGKSYGPWDTPHRAFGGTVADIV